MDKYFVVSMNDDGEWSFDQYDDIDEVRENYGIDEPIDNYMKGCHPTEDFTNYIDENNPGSVLIYGKILLPKKKEVVIKWEFEET